MLIRNLLRREHRRPHPIQTNTRHNDAQPPLPSKRHSPSQSQSRVKLFGARGTKTLRIWLRSSNKKSHLEGKPSRELEGACIRAREVQRPECARVYIDADLVVLSVIAEADSIGYVLAVDA